MQSIAFSADLDIKIVNENQDSIDGIVVFSPGEYFKELSSCKSCISDSAKKLLYLFLFHLKK